MRDARLYFRYVGFSIRSQMQYRASMLIYIFGQLLITDQAEQVALPGAAAAEAGGGCRSRRH